MEKIRSWQTFMFLSLRRAGLFQLSPKFGSITAANLGEAVAAFLQDVREEASKTNPELIYFFTVRKLSRLIRKLLR